MSLQTIFNTLTAAGMTSAGALGTMGNLQAESGCEACRLQGDFTTGRTKSHEYAEKVDSGSLSKHVFMYDAQGWGIYQLTHFSRKGGFYDFVKAEGGSIADLDLQLKYLVKEMKGSYPNLWAYLCESTDIYMAVSRVCSEFERPAHNNFAQRYEYALQIQKQITEKHYWPPRKLKKGMSGADVEVLQAILKARGYPVNYVSGRFDDILEKAVNAFKAENRLGVPGIVGKKTWDKLLKRS